MVDLTGDGPRIRRNVYEVLQNGEVQNELNKTPAKPKKKKKKAEAEEDGSDDENDAGRARKRPI